MRSQKKILYVDRDDDNCELIKFVFESAHCKVTCTNDAFKALKLARQNRFSAVILEFRQTNMSGIELCAAMRKYKPLTPVIFFTSSAFPSERNAGLAAGANAYLVKPNDFDRLEKVVFDLIKKADQLSASISAQLVSTDFYSQFRLHPLI